MKYVVAMLALFANGTIAHAQLGGSVIVGSGVAAEWENGRATLLQVDESMPPSFPFSLAYAIDNSGQITGMGTDASSIYAGQNTIVWSSPNSVGRIVSTVPVTTSPFDVFGGVWNFNGSYWINNLPELPNAINSKIIATNSLGQSVGFSFILHLYYNIPWAIPEATEWSDGNVIDLGAQWPEQPRIGFGSVAVAINDSGQAVGWYGPYPIPEASTWTMMILASLIILLPSARRLSPQPPV
jgi:hypothetical protein